MRSSGLCRPGVLVVRSLVGLSGFGGWTLASWWFDAGNLALYRSVAELVEAPYSRLLATNATQRNYVS